MGIFKNLIIIVLILLVLGLYYYTDETKAFMQITGKHSLDVGKKLFNEIKEKAQETNLEDIEEKIKEKS